MISGVVTLERSLPFAGAASLSSDESETIPSALDPRVEETGTAGSVAASEALRVFPAAVPQVTKDRRTATRDSSPWRLSCCSERPRLWLSALPGTANAVVLRAGGTLDELCFVEGVKAGLLAGSFDLGAGALECVDEIFEMVFIKL